MLARGLTYERLLLGGEGQMAVRLWSSGLHGLSMASLPRLRPSCHLLCNFCKILFFISLLDLSHWDLLALEMLRRHLNPNP